MEPLFYKSEENLKIKKNIKLRKWKYVREIKTYICIKSDKIISTVYCVLKIYSC